jgi:hypothetical protein
VAVGCAEAPLPAAAPVPSTLVASTAGLAELSLRYTGTYVYVGGDTERHAVAAAVERAIAGLGFLGKPVARQSLRQRAEVREAYTLFFDGLGNCRLNSPGFPVELAPLDGRPAPLQTKSGDKTELRMHFEDGVLLQQGRTDEGSGRTEFRLTEDGTTLLVHRVMESAQLTAPVDFSLTYQRSGARP